MRLLILLPAAFFTMMASALAGDGSDPMLGIDWGQWGLAGLVTGLTMWMSWLREQRMSAKLDEQDKWIKEKLISVLERVADAPCQEEKKGK